MEDGSSPIPEKEKETVMGPEDLRSWWKFLKEQRKLKKKAKKEEEFLANLRKPKDTKVVMADKKVAEQLMACMTTNMGAKQSNGQNCGFSIESNDFPALGTSLLSGSPKANMPKTSKTYKNAVDGTRNASPRKKLRNGLSSESSARTEEKSKTVPSVAIVDSNVPKVDHSRALQQDNTSQDKNNVLKPSVSHATNRDSKNRKKKDPIELNIYELLTAKKSAVKDKKFVVYGSKFQRPTESYYSCGNILDSSNQKGKRGKHRENRKKKLTKFKLAIIKDRISKSKALLQREKPPHATVETAKLDRENENVSIKVEIDKYLSELTKNLKITKRIDNSGKTENRTVKQNIVIGNEVVECGNRSVITEAANGEAKSDDGGGLTEESKRKPKKVNARKRTKYRKYCENSFSANLDKAVNELIENVVHLQDKAFAKNPIKAKARQRHVAGLREVKKYLMLKKIKLLIIAPDLEAQETVYETIEELKKSAAAQHVPCIFALSRRKLGFATKKKNRAENVKYHLKEAQAKREKAPELGGSEVIS